MKNGNRTYTPIIHLSGQANTHCNGSFCASFNNNQSPLRLVWPSANPEKKQGGITEADIADIIKRVRDNERMLIGQELHDNVNQILYTVRLFIEMLQASSPNDKSIHQKSVEYLAMAIDEIRRLSHELVKAKPEEKGLAGNIQQMVDDVQLATTIRISFKHCQDVESLSQEKKITLLRIVQEQMKNIIQHSKADLVSISINGSNGNVSLLIRDNGVGFDPYLDHKGIGLPNIYERAKAHNGLVTLDTAKGHGCTLTVCLPA